MSGPGKDVGIRPADNFRRRAKGRFSPSSLTYHCTFLDRNVEYKRRTRDLIFELLRPRVREVLNGYSFLNASFYVKPPRSGVFQVHQNWPHLVDMSDTTISIWCPLADTDRHNGTIEVISSSHKIVPDIACTNSPPFFDGFVGTLIEKYLEVDPDYFITHTGDDLADIPKERKSLGYVPNPNRFLTEKEFAERLANGESTRRALWSAPQAAF